MTGPGGTAEGVAPARFPVAMKTGTALHAPARLPRQLRRRGSPARSGAGVLPARHTPRLVGVGQRRRPRSPWRPAGPAGRRARQALRHGAAAAPAAYHHAECRSSSWTSASCFRHPSCAEDGLLAVGGDLRPERLLTAYAQGIFPWYEDGLPILWHSPDPRMVLRADGSTSRTAWPRPCAGPYQITLDSAFRDVVEACASMDRPGQEGTWITAEMIRAYEVLHRLGFAHSVEAWRGDELMGGLYGVSLGSAFFGESMFSRADDASKVAFVTLVRDLARRGIGLVDCQVHTDHLARFGATESPRERFLDALAIALRNPTRKGKWRLGAASPH